MGVFWRVRTMQTGPLQEMLRELRSPVGLRPTIRTVQASPTPAMRPSGSFRRIQAARASAAALKIV